MKNLPLVSLCIPIFNGSKFIESLFEIIKSISYNNLEVMIVDDYSKDNSWQLILDNVDKYQNLEGKSIKFFQHQQNQGLVNNWNYCIKKAQGKYIKFLFQDDLITPDCIEKMVKITEEDDKIGLVFSCRSLISDQPIDSKDFPENLHLGWSNLQNIQSGLNLLQDKNLLEHPHNKIGEPTNILIRKKVFNQVGYFDSSFKQYADLEMWLRIMTHYKIAFIDEKLAYFRIHAQQTTNINLTKDISWSEIYEVWLKLVSDSIYDVIPLTTRKLIKIKIINKLMREFLKMILLRKLHRFSKLIQLIKYTLSLKI